jgi:hypothetical protein
MGSPCTTYGGEEKFIEGFRGKNVRKVDHFEDQGCELTEIRKKLAADISVY